MSTHPLPSDVQDLEHRIARLMANANGDFGMYGEGDRILVGISGGKDSWTLLHLLRRVQRKAPFRFELLAFHLDQGHPGFPTDLLESYLRAEGYEYVIHRADTYSIVTDKVAPGSTPCSLCSRLRRGILYTEAVRLGCNRIALGHHREDLIETLLLNLFYSGQLQTMPPKLKSDDGRNIVIRPLAFVPEAWIADYARAMRFPVVPCVLCGRGRDLKRDRMGDLVTALEKEIPDVKKSLMAAMANVHLSHLLDSRVFDPRALDADLR